MAEDSFGSTCIANLLLLLLNLFCGGGLDCVSGFRPTGPPIRSTRTTTLARWSGRDRSAPALTARATTVGRSCTLLAEFRCQNRHIFWSTLKAVHITACWQRLHPWRLRRGLCGGQLRPCRRWRRRHLHRFQHLHQLRLWHCQARRRCCLRQQGHLGERRRSGQWQHERGMCNVQCGLSVLCEFELRVTYCCEQGNSAITSKGRTIQ